MAKRNRSRKNRYSRPRYTTKVAKSRKRVRYTRNYLLSEPYRLQVRKKWTYSPRYKNLKNLIQGDRLTRINDHKAPPKRKQLKSKNYFDYFKRMRRIREANKIIKECTRRKRRREVIFAKKLKGKGSGARRHKLRPESKIKC